MFRLVALPRLRVPVRASRVIRLAVADNHVDHRMSAMERSTAFWLNRLNVQLRIREIGKRYIGVTGYRISNIFQDKVFHTVHILADQAYG